MPNVIGLIPARGGSKGFPGKNIADLSGKPLIAYTIESALKSGVCNSVIVSSDNDNILDIAEKFGAIRYKRSSESSQDHSTTDEAIHEFILSQNLSEDTLIILLQPTSPLRNAGHIKGALQNYVEKIQDKDQTWMLQSVCECDPKVLYAYSRVGESLTPICEWAETITQRQQLPAVYLPNGAIYIFSVKSFSQENKIPKMYILPFVMSENLSVDIDKEEDLLLCSKLLEQSG